jgi:hypothetical protein
MANARGTNPETLKIQGLIGRYLELRASGGDSPDHLDTDTLTAFSEGRLSEREAAPVVRHLSDCGFCRHITTELVRLDVSFADREEPVAIRDTRSEPSSVSSVLSGILSRIFGSGESAVFAHKEPEETDEDKAKDEEKKED